MAFAKEETYVEIILNNSERGIFIVIWDIDIWCKLYFYNGKCKNSKWWWKTLSLYYHDWKSGHSNKQSWNRLW